MSVVVVSNIAGTSDADITGVTAGAGATGGGTTGTVTIGVDVGTGPNQIVQLDASSRLPAVDGSQLTNISSSSISGTLPIANGGTAATTAPLARVSLNIDQRRTFSNADVTALNTDRHLAQVGTMSAPRVVTLPAASSVNAGQKLVIADESGTVSTTNLLTITAAGSDTIDGSASKTVRSAYGQAELTSNGSNMWFRPVTGIGAGGTGISSTPINGQLLVGNTTTNDYTLTTITGGMGVTVTNGPGTISLASGNTLTTKTSNYTVLSTDNVILCDTSGGAFNLTLPTPSTVIGTIFRVIDKTGSFGTNNLTLVRAGSEKIMGLTSSKVLQTDWGFFEVVTDGTDWYLG